MVLMVHLHAFPMALSVLPAPQRRIGMYCNYVSLLIKISPHDLLSDALRLEECCKTGVCNVVKQVEIPVGHLPFYYSWNGGRAEAMCAGGKGVRMR
jgi:hypothetical protein